MATKSATGAALVFCTLTSATATTRAQSAGPPGTVTRAAEPQGAAGVVGVAPSASTRPPRGASVVLARATPATPEIRLRYDLRFDLPITLVGGAAWLTTEVLKSTIAPEPCRWCDRAADGSDTLNGLDASVRSGLRWSEVTLPEVLSNVAGFALAPVGAFGLTALAALNDGRPGGVLVDALLVAEATVIAIDLNQLTKFLAGRERPFVHFATPAERATFTNPADNNLSFFSGHATFTFALAVSSGTVATMRRYRLAPAVWATGLTLATATSYLRVAADRHYLTDVITGAIVGSAVGFLVPWLFHGPLPTPGGARVALLAPLPLAGGGGLALTGMW